MNQIKKIGAVTLLGLLPLVTQAQQHIKAAFDALVQDNSVELSVEHKLEKDPETGIKESQFDFWEFTLPKSKQVLVKNIQQAFAWTVNRLTPSARGATRGAVRA